MCLPIRPTPLASPPPPLRPCTYPPPPHLRILQCAVPRRRPCCALLGRARSGRPRWEGLSGGPMCACGARA
eukprot:3563652-Pyramimonas_sp.AAC.1